MQYQKCKSKTFNRKKSFMDRREALKNTAVILGYTLTIPALTSILESCNNSSSADWSPVVFNEQQAKLMAELASAILPKTTLPGARNCTLTGLPIC